jgi:uncharacterized Tic20 family protein
MSQTPHPHDPFGTEPGTPATDALPEQPAERPASDHLDIDAPDAPAPQEQAAATSDPAVHPHDPYARSVGSPQPHGAAEPEAVPAAAPHAPQQSPYAPQPAPHDPYAQQAAPQPQPQHPVPYPAPQGHSHAGGTMPLDQAPAHLKGVFDGPLTGQPISDSDSKLWAMFAQLSAIVGYVIGAGFLGWLGPLIIFLVYKDRDRYVRYNAAESLNAAIATLIAEIALGVVITFLTIITFGIGSVLYVLIGVPALLHIIFAIIGAVKANQGEWWNYPLNIRFVK